MARITSSTYLDTSRRATSRSGPVDRLAARLQVEPRTVHELAKRLDVALRLLDIASGPDVLAGTPASYEAMVVCGLDPLTGEPLIHGRSVWPGARES